MKLELVGHDDRYAVEQLQMALFSVESEGEAISRLHRGKKWLTAVTKITRDGKTTRSTKRLAGARETVPLRRRILQQSYYQAALPHLQKAPQWGAMSGVRPTKLTTAHLLQGGSERSARRMMQSDYYVSPQRSALAVDCSKATVRAMEKLESRDISLYIGIPFCPTRCSYCSFVSSSAGNGTKLLAPYLQALQKELAFTGKLLEKSGRSPRTIYIGGGTPTTLTAEQLAWLFEQIRKSVDLSRCIEFTVEGGRPDTLNAEKFAVISDYGAQRISINPQTMRQSVLDACGRPHSPDDVVERYREACRTGFEAINMDLIAGLPTDTFDGFRYSLDTVAALSPANITVHTLALKKGADLFAKRQLLPSEQAVTQMVDYAEKTLRSLGYRPYYLYRQKYMTGSFENVGWTKENMDCLYNIYMMEEVHTVLSVGGGGMNKVNLPDGTITRFHNPKFPQDYIRQLESVLAQKEEIFQML